MQHCNWFGFRISLSREGAIFRDEIENYFPCSRLARRERYFHMIILVFRDENEITQYHSHVLRRDRDLENHFSWSSEKNQADFHESSRDQELSLTFGPNAKGP